MAEKISFQKITLQNLDLACQIQNAIFPEEDGRQNFIEQINNDHYRKEQDYRMRGSGRFSGTLSDGFALGSV